MTPRARFARASRSWLARARHAVPVLLALLAIAIVGATAGDASAHDLSYSWIDLDWSGDRITAKVSVHRNDAAALLGVAAPESLMRPEVLAREAPRLARLIGPRLRVRTDDHPVALRYLAAAAEPSRRAVALRFVAAPLHASGRLSVEARLFPDDPLHQTFLDVYSGGRLIRQEVLDDRRAGVEIFGRGAGGALAALATFLGAGIHHIFIGPDHILFIVGLLLLGGGLLRVLKVATAFTAAHSITLALAGLGWLHPPGRLVEPLIALSIVYVGVENLRARTGVPDWRTRIAFGFGLVHGFGFASVLQQFGLPREALGWSLLGFNLGVEVGQAAIVLAVAPLLAALRSLAPRAAPRVVAAGSWGIVLAGGYWFVQRVVAGG